MMFYLFMASHNLVSLFSFPPLTAKKKIKKNATVLAPAGMFCVHASVIFNETPCRGLEVSMRTCKKLQRHKLPFMKSVRRYISYFQTNQVKLD